MEKQEYLYPMGYIFGVQVCFWPIHAAENGQIIPYRV